MSDPKRLLDDGGTTALQRSLLGAYEGEAPSAASRARTLAALGVATAAAGSLASGTAASGSPSIPVAAKTAGLLAYGKWPFVLVGLGFLGAGSYAAATLVPRARTSGSVTAASTRVAATTTAGLPTPAAPEASVAFEVVSPEALPAAPEDSVSAASPGARPRRVYATRGGGADDSLRAELSLVDRTRESFARGDYAATIKGVSTYEARYPHGAFEQEAEFLRVRALFATPNVPAARAAGASFLTKYPASPYAPKVRALLEQSP